MAPYFQADVCCLHASAPRFVFGLQCHRRQWHTAERRVELERSHQANKLSQLEILELAQGQKRLHFFIALEAVDRAMERLQPLHENLLLHIERHGDATNSGTSLDLPSDLVQEVARNNVVSAYIHSKSIGKQLHDWAAMKEKKYDPIIAQLSPLVEHHAQNMYWRCLSQTRELLSGFGVTAPLANG